MFKKLLTYGFIQNSLAAEPGQWEDATDENGQKMQKVSIQAPQMTEEEDNSQIMPPQHRCPACHAVFFQISKSLSQLYKDKGGDKKKKDGKKPKIGEDLVIDILEQTCKNGFAEGYGVSAINGGNYLQGPGIEKKEDKSSMAAIMMGGGKWPNRISQMCKAMVEELEEGEIFKMWEKEQKLDGAEMCDSEYFSYCSKKNMDAAKKAQAKTQAPPKEKKEKKPKEKKVEKKVENVEITIRSFLEQQEKLSHQNYGAFSKSRSKNEWLKLFSQILDKNEGRTEL